MLAVDLSRVSHHDLFPVDRRQRRNAQVNRGGPSTVVLIRPS